jgi:hypothetical protein
VRARLFAVSRASCVSPDILYCSEKILACHPHPSPLLRSCRASSSGVGVRSDLGTAMTSSCARETVLVVRNEWSTSAGVVKTWPQGPDRIEVALLPSRSSPRQACGQSPVSARGDELVSPSEQMAVAAGGGEKVSSSRPAAGWGVAGRVSGRPAWRREWQAGGWV